MNWKLTWIFCNILNVFTVTFDQFNASMLNKSINFFKINVLTLKTLNGGVYSKLY